MKSFRLFTFFFLLSLSTQAQDIIIGKTHQLSSKILGEEREIYISLPDNYQNSKDTYPVLYVLDGDEYFRMASSAVRYFANRGFMPQTIVVGISNAQHRDRDLTPTKDDWSPTGGGAALFLDFISKELIPYIESNHRCKPHRTLYGASYGGLFTLYALFNQSEHFDAYLSVSPSVFHDDGLIFKQALQYFQNPSKEKKYVFLSLADERFQEMRIHFDNMISLFRDHPMENLRWHYKYYQEETHETTKLRGLNDGLRDLHYHWFIPFYQRNRGIEGLKEHVALLGRVYGYEIPLSSSMVNRTGYTKLRDGDFEAAIKLFQYNIDHFPQDPNAYDSLGEAYEKMENWEKAKLYFGKAVEVAKKQGLKNEIYQKNLMRVIKKVGGK